MTLRELFQDTENFNVCTALKATRHIPVEELSKQLKKLTETVQDELFELINHDFAKFQEILRRVCDVDMTKLKSFRDNLAQVKKANENSFNEFKAYYETIKAKYERVEYVKRKLELNTNLQRTNNYLARFKTLKQKPISEISPFEIEIACLNYLWISQFLSESQSATEIDFQLLVGELSAFSEGLQSLLEDKIVMQLKLDEDVNMLAKLCSKLNKLNIFESCFRFVKVEEPLQELLRDSIDASSHSLVNFPGFLDKCFALLDGLVQRWNPLIDALYHENRHKFLVRALFGPTLAWLQDSLSSVFIPSSKAAEFKTNFTSALAFVSKLEESFFCYEDEVSYFRAHSAWSSFMKKWALHQYFQLQLRQTINPIEIVLAKPLEIGNDPKLLEQSVHCLSALKQLWSPASLITPLVPKVLKTSIQLVRRFIHFTAEDAAVFNNPATFSLCLLQKRFNLSQFNRLFKETVLPLMRNALEPLEEGLTPRLQESFNKEIGAAIHSIEERLLPGIEQIYEKLLIIAPTKQSLEQLSFASLLLLKQSKFDYKAQPEALAASLQRILIKVNRAVFKLHDQLGPQSLSFFLEKMLQLEGEAHQLGREGLASEEFWSEIRQTISQ